MNSYQSLEERNHNNQMAVMLATRNYIQGKEDIAETVKSLNMMYKAIDEIPDTYSTTISYWLDKVEMISYTMRMKKLENHQADAMYLLNKLIEYVDEVKKVIKEKASEE